MAAPMSVLPVPWNRFIAGEYTATSDFEGFLNGSTAVPVSGQHCECVMVQAKHANAGIVYVGNTSNQVWELPPGSSVTLPVKDFYAIKVKISAGDGINYLVGIY